jgi:anti-sigma factor RsiW
MDWVRRDGLASSTSARGGVDCAARPPYYVRVGAAASHSLADGNYCVMQDIEDQRSLKQYLLGQLSQEEQRQLEVRLLNDQQFLVELLMAEDELIDEYLDGSLSEQDREKFEQHFLATTERREKLTFAKALRRYVTEARDREKLRGCRSRE